MRNKSEVACQEPKYFTYSNEDIEWLKRDPPMARLIDSVGPIKRRVYPDLFHGIVRTVMGQQISSRVHEVLWDRYLASYGEATPCHIAALTPEKLKTIGISSRKAEYIHKIASLFANGQINREELDEMGNYSLSKTLAELPGIGPWSAEMLLIFTFQRENVISFNDLGIKKGLMKLYNIKNLTWTRFIDRTRPYSPVSTLASFYLWELAGSNISLP